MVWRAHPLEGPSYRRDWGPVFGSASHPHVDTDQVFRSSSLSSGGKFHHLSLIVARAILVRRLDPNRPEGNLKSLGGGKADEWNNRLSNLTIGALAVAQSKDKNAIMEASLAVS